VREAWRKVHNDIRKEREMEGEVRNRIAEFDEALYWESQPKIKVRKSRFDLVRRSMKMNTRLG
jgi:hypothetical protein